MDMRLTIEATLFRLVPILFVVVVVVLGERVGTLRKKETMPIRPENKDRYPANWPDIRQSILDRAGNCCEVCGVRNGAVGYRDPCGEFIETPAYEADPGYWDGQWEVKIFKIVLTVMHLDHTPENCDPANLKAACQRCHNEYDAPVRAAGKKRRRRARIAESQGVLKLNTQGASGGSDRKAILSETVGSGARDRGCTGFYSSRS